MGVRSLQSSQRPQTPHYLQARLHPKSSGDGGKHGDDYLQDLFPDRRFVLHSYLGYEVIRYEVLRL